MRSLETTESAPLVRLADISKTYIEGDVQHVVLDRVCAEVAAGEFVVLLGPSGSGKSTLLNIIGGMDQPDGGTVGIAGADITALDERARTLFRRRHIGFVFQFFNLIPTLTVAENLRLPLELNGRAAGHADVVRLLEQVGLGARAGSYPDRLSGGEQQRVAVARAIVHGPALLLADEPTGNLDAETGKGVLDLLESLARDRGTTLIVATHAASIVQRADRVLALRGAGLVEEAVPS